MSRAKTIKAGRRIGSKVKLTPFARRLYPQFAHKVGKIVGKEVQTIGRGLAYGQRARYKIAYRVKFASEKRAYLLGAEHLTKA